MDAKINGHAYAVRASTLAEERTYRLTDCALAWDTSGGHGQLAFPDVAAIRRPNQQELFQPEFVR